MVQASDKGFSSAMNAKILGSTLGGNTDTIVLAHGFGTDQSIWDKILPCLAQNFRVLLFDWNFSGAVKDQSIYDPVKCSTYDVFADDLINLLDEMELKSTSFVGHSMSGMIGCIASVKRPELFKRLILIGASPRYVNVDEYEGGFKNSDIEEMISNIETNYENWASGFASLVVDPRDALSVDKFLKCLLAMTPEVTLPLAKSVFYSDEREVLEKVMTQCTIIQTSNDVVVPNSVPVFMQKKIKGKSTIEIIDTNGHFPQLTAHLQLLNVLKRVLELDLITPDARLQK